MKKLTTEQFIEKAKLKHKNKYDYSLVNYKSGRSRIDIICLEHGKFKQIARNHLVGHGCPVCYKESSIITLNDFIDKAKNIHGDKYDYKLVCYKNNKTKVDILCLKHGIFKQTPSSHLNMAGCPYCAEKKLTKKQFIDKANKVHGSKYDYSQANYINNKTKVNIICKEHGIFNQTAGSHLNGQSCPYCSNKRLTTKQFIDKAKNIHGDKYDYKLVCYKNNRTKVDIICKEHGVFKQIANYHIRGSGCPVCNESKGEKEVAKWLDKNNIKYIRQKRFNDCKNIRSLPFDFYIYSLNMCIEYDGKQHFEAIDFFGGEEGLIYIQNNDRIKTQYCINNNMKLVRIKYNEKIVGKLLFLTKYKHI